MKSVKNLALATMFLAAFALFSFKMTMVQEWTVVAEDVSITFTGKKADGQFSGLQAMIKFSPEDLLNSKLEATIPTATIDLGNKMQTKHALSDKWMDAETFPEIKFVSSEITATDAGFTAKGDLTLHGVTNAIEMPFTFEKTDDGGVFRSDLHIARDDYKIGKPDGGYVREVDVKIEVPVKE